MFTKLFSVGALVALLSTGIAFTGKSAGTPKPQDDCCACCCLDCELCALLCGGCCEDCCDLKNCADCCKDGACKDGACKDCCIQPAPQQVSSLKEKGCCAPAPTAATTKAKSNDCAAGSCCQGGK